MNIVLFELDETKHPLPRTDPRAEHLLKVLRRREGDAFDAGLIDGPRGRGVVKAIGAEELTLAFEWRAEPEPADPIELVIGLPRPQTARKILHEATALGVSAMHFVATELGERSYAQSTLWKSGEWRRHLIAGASQAFCTRLPELTYGRKLAEVLARAPSDAIRIALDNYEASQALGRCRLALDARIVLAIGSERGWSDAERAKLREHGFTLAHLGTRVLRVETACVAALALIKTKLGSL